MSKETLKYTNEKVTVVWKPKLCIHSAICLKGLPEVFNPKARPWVNINSATAAQIVEQVRRCPSGALSIENGQEPTPLNTVTEEEAKSQQTVIQIMKNGPVLVKGASVIQTPDGKEEVREGVVACAGAVLLQTNLIVTEVTERLTFVTADKTLFSN